MWVGSLAERHEIRKLVQLFIVVRDADCGSRSYACFVRCVMKAPPCDPIAAVFVADLKWRPPMHSPIQDIALSSFTERASFGLRPLADRLRAMALTMRRHIAVWRSNIRTRNQLRQLIDSAWATRDIGVSRWQAEAELRKPFWAD